jgi:signal transduction histidine kinase
MARVAGDDVEIAVSDNGPGIPPDQLEHIFERFVRGEAGLTQRVGGTGLGLPISKSLVELHGGRLEVDSTIGTGSTFSFHLPLATSTAALPNPQDGARPAREKAESH